MGSKLAAVLLFVFSAVSVPLFFQNCGRWTPGANSTSFELPADEPQMPEGEKKEVTGIVTLSIADDFKNSTSQHIFTLLDEKSGQKIRMRSVKRGFNQLQAGMKIKVTGTFSKGDFYILNDNDLRNIQTLQAPATNPYQLSGDVSIFGVILKFQGQTSSPCTWNYAQSALGLSTEAPWEAKSFYQFHSAKELNLKPYFPTTSQSIIELPFTQDSLEAQCDSSNYYRKLEEWAVYAENEIKKTRLDLDRNFPIHFFVLPPGNTCPIGGMGNYPIGSNQPLKAWVQPYCGEDQTFFKNAATHEIGHNLGMNHASTPDAEYGDASDVMGDTNAGLLSALNAPHMVFMGWKERTMLTGSGKIIINPLHSGLGSEIFSMTAPDKEYFVSFRDDQGYNANIPEQEKFKVHVHFINPFNKRTFKLKILRQYESFVTPDGKFKVKYLRGRKRAVVRVLFLDTPSAATAESAGD